MSELCDAVEVQWTTPDAPMILMESTVDYRCYAVVHSHLQGNL